MYHCWSLLVGRGRQNWLYVTELAICICPSNSENMLIKNCFECIVYIRSF